jgi:uncharacterized protein YegJ (DUF2314 family)
MRKSMPVVLASLGIGLGVAGCGLGGEQSVTAKAESDQVVMAGADDPAMLQAFARAQATLDGFLVHVAAQDPVLQEALVKIKVQEGEAVEYFWIGSLTQKSDGLTGIVKNEPEVVHNIKNGQTIAFPRTQIFDWMYIDAKSGKMIGNYTACALLSHEKPGAAAEFRRTYHLDCDP